MKINADLIIKLRKEKTWTQDELSIAAGLNLRTIQRVEREATASIQSKKAIASALDVDTRDLDYDRLPVLISMKNNETSHPIPFRSGAIYEGFPGILEAKGLLSLETDHLYLIFEMIVVNLIPLQTTKIKISFNDLESLNIKKSFLNTSLRIKTVSADILEDWPKMHAGYISLYVKKGYTNDLEKMLTSFNATSTTNYQVDN